MIVHITARLQNAWFNARDKESGQTLVEYALIISIVSLGAVAALVFLRGRITGLFSNAGSKIQQGSTLTG